MTVDGTGSIWNNCGVSIGCNNGSGTLSITGGGGVNGYGASIGCSGSSSSGTVTVDGPGSTWANNWGSLSIGSAGGTGTLSITGGGTVTSSTAYLGNGAGSMGTVKVDGAGSTWINNGDLYAGYWGAAGGTLSITGGGSVSNNYGYIGHAGSTGTVTVDGAASSWVNRYDLCVGDDTDGNGGVGTLAITHGAAVSVGGATYVGWGNGSTGGIQFGANGGTLTTQSLWASPSQLTGNGTINTQGLVSDVNLVFDSTASLSQTLTFNGPGQNIALHLDMTGDSSTNGVLGAGYQGSGSVTIRNGVTVNSNLGYIGCQSGSAGIVTVDGAGSAWANGNALYVGYSGNGTLAITGGGSVNNNCGYIGYNSGSTGAVTVDGAGSSWTNSNFLAIGYSGSGSLSITNGGDVSNPYGYAAYVGYNSGSMGVMKVDGAGSTWTNASDLYVGLYGQGTLSITGGGNVSNTIGHVGSAGGSSGSVNVDGAGSAWTNSSFLYVGGDNSSYNIGGSGTLNITNGGFVTNTIGYIGCGGGYTTGPTGIVTVDGAGSKWFNRNQLYVGGSGPNCYYFGGSATLNIANGGSVSDTTGYIGYGSGYTSGPTGTVAVDGSGSSWTNRGFLYVGAGNSSSFVPGSGTLSISNGGAVSNTNGYIGYASASGAVTLDGAGSKWTNSGNLYVGYSGTGTATQTGGTNSVAGTLNLGHDASGSGTYNLNGGVLAVSGLSMVPARPPSTSAVERSRLTPLSPLRCR